MTTSTTKTKTKTKAKKDLSNSLCYRLNKNTSDNAKKIVEYLQKSRDRLSPNQKINNLVFLNLLPFAISKDDENYDEVVLETLSFYHAQIRLLETISGLSLNPQFQSTQPVLSQPIAQSQPIVQSQPIAQSQALSLPQSKPVQPVLSQPIAQSQSKSVPQQETISDTCGGDRDYEVIEQYQEESVTSASDSEPTNEPINKEEIQTKNNNESDIELSATNFSIPKNYEELKGIINKLSESIKNIDSSNENTFSILKNAFMNIQPEKSESWTDEMWDLYEDFDIQVREIEDRIVEYRRNNSQPN